MPSFYPPHRPAQFGYHPSEYDAHPLQPQYAAYSDLAHPNGGHFGSKGNDFHHLHPNSYEYKMAQLYSGAGYGQAPRNYPNSAHVGQHLSAPIVAPLRVSEYTLQQTNAKRMHNSDRPSYPQQSNEDDRPVGGVSAKLDYNMEEMTDFVVDMAVALVAPNSYNSDTYRKWVVQVLNATRLPSATILLSLSYLTLRIRHLSESRRFQPSEYSLYELLTIALILGSKFLDDNTFQNKSWAEVSNIKVAVLNREELEWLKSFGHRLHHAPNGPDGFDYWERCWTSFHAKKKAAAIANNLHTPDQGTHYQRSQRSTVTGPHYHPQYPVSAMSNIALEPKATQPAYVTPTYSPYESWYGQRSTVERSPSTAPHTGPNTPEFYAGQGGWNGFDPYSGRTRPYAYGGPSPMAHNFEAYPPTYEATNMTYGGPNVWNCHGAACQCSSCRQAQASRYGPIVVG